MNSNAEGQYRFINQLEQIIIGLDLGDLANLILAIATVSLAWVACRARTDWVDQQDREFRRGQGLKLIEYYELYSRIKISIFLANKKNENEDDVYKVQEDKFLSSMINFITHLNLIFRIMKWPISERDKLRDSIVSGHKAAIKGELSGDSGYDVKEQRERILRIAEVLILDEKGHKQPPEPDLFEETIPE